MKLSIISDTHLGHPDCTLVTKRNIQYRTTSYYEALKETIPEGNEYLLLLGILLTLVSPVTQRLTMRPPTDLMAEHKYLPNNGQYSCYSP